MASSSGVTETVALSTLLAQLLVAFTIEVDEQFEADMPHSATVKHGAGLHGGPWLVSHVMWANYLRHIDATGTPAGVLQVRARVSTRTIKSRLNHLGWWGYLTVDDGKGTKYAEQLVRLTPGGARAGAAFEPLSNLVEQRWRDRFGDGCIDDLRAALAPVVDAVPAGLPRAMPVVDYGDGMRTEVVFPAEAPSERSDESDDLLAHLSLALLRFTLDFESGSTVSLPHLANVLRVLDSTPVPVKEVPLMAGVSKQAIDASITHLVKAGTVETRGKGAKAMVLLTEAGRELRTKSRRRLTTVEKSWEREHGVGAIDRLRGVLGSVLGAKDGEGSVLAQGLTPHEGAWRAHKNYRAQTDAVLADPRRALPHHPMVLHRGGFPDGS